MFPESLCNSAIPRALDCINADDCCRETRQAKMICENNEGYAEFATAANLALIAEYVASAACRNGGEDNSYVNCNPTTRIPDLFAGQPNAE